MAAARSSSGLAMDTGPDIVRRGLGHPDTVRRGHGHLEDARQARDRPEDARPAQDRPVAADRPSCLPDRGRARRDARGTERILRQDTRAPGRRTCSDFDLRCQAGGFSSDPSTMDQNSTVFPDYADVPSR